MLALKGIGSLILKNEDIDIVLEYHPYEMSFFKISGIDLLDYLEEFGYKFRDLSSNIFPVISKHEILSTYQKKDYGITNLFCSKSK